MMVIKRRTLTRAIGLALLGAGTGAGAQNIDLGILGNDGYVIQGDTRFDRAGQSVSLAGDFNGDGQNDVLVGASGADPSPLGPAGRAYLVFGPPSSGPLWLRELGDRGFRFIRATDREFLGYSVTGVGDFDGDGFDDIAVSGLGYNNYAGRVFVVFGEAEPDTVDLSSLGDRGLEINQPNILNRFGFSIAAAGDVNGDGFDDLVIGAPLADPVGRNNAGEVYVIFGQDRRSSLDVSSLGSRGFLIRGPSGEGAGDSVGGGGDIDGDGLDDIVIGTTGLDDRSFVVFGQAGNTTIDLATLGLRGFPIENVNAESIAVAGDVDNDGLDDVVIGERLFGTDNRGRGVVVFGRDSIAPVDAANLGNDGFLILAEDAGGELGSAVAAAGDVDGDGFADVLIGARNATFPGGAVESGMAYVVYGRAGASNIDLSTLTAADGLRLVGSAGGDKAGRAVSGAGDLDGDGLADLLVGAYDADPNLRTGAGEAYVVLSPASPPPSATYFDSAPAGNASIDIGATHPAALPWSRASIAYTGGSGTGPSGSSEEQATLARFAFPFADAAANVRWALSTTRQGWTSAEVTFTVLPDELLVSPASRLQIVRASSETGPFRTLPSHWDPETGTVTAETTELGLFFINALPPLEAGEFRFLVQQREAQESDGTLSVSVERIDGSETAVEARVTSVDDSAVAGLDYVAVDEVLSWADGDSGVRTFNVSILEDGLEEDPVETFTLQLAVESGAATLGAPATLTVRIRDDDGENLFSDGFES